MVPGTILGHEGVGLVEEVGRDVRNLKKGDRVVIPSTVGCGICSYCRAGYLAQCDNANPAGKQGGTVFFGGPKDAGGLPGLQAEFARVPYATAIDAYKQFDQRKAGWIKVELKPLGSANPIRAEVIRDDVHV
jgi:threonine dehydrogenase-like Zn-dependent dehydrogenase